MTDTVIEVAPAESTTSFEATAKVVKEVKVEEAVVEVEKPEDFVEVHGVRADLLENSVKLHLSNGTTRLISYPDFAQTLLTFLDKAQETKVATVRLLPSNLYVIEETVSTLNLGFYFPERIQKVNYRNDIKDRVVPNIILNVYLTKGPNKGDYKFRDAKYYCTNLPLSRLTKTMVTGTGPNINILPFTNVYREGNLCMGGNAVITDFLANDLRPTIWYHDMLWASPFNDDLGVAALKRDSTFRENHSAWYSHLAKLAKDGKGFPYKEITNMTDS